MENTSSTGSGQHRRNQSGRVRRQAILRRSTHDPLEAAAATATAATASDSSSNDDTHGHPPPPSRPHLSYDSAAASSKIMSEEPSGDKQSNASLNRRQGLEMSSESTLSAASNEQQQQQSLPSVGIVEQEVESRDYGFILHPSNFHALNEQDIPPAIRQDNTRQQLQTASLQELLDRGYFFAAAQRAAQQLRLPSTLPTDHARIFSLLYIRLACLQLLSLHGLAAQESKCLQDLSAPIYIDDVSGKHLVPWRLRVLVVRLQAIGFNDWRKGVMAYYELAREARAAAHHAQLSSDPPSAALWQDRLAELGVLVGNALVEMGDLEGAVRHLRTLVVDYDHDSDDDGGSERASRSGIHRTRLAILLLRIGDTNAAQHLLSSSGNQDVASDEDDLTPATSILQAVLLMADGHFHDAATQWESLLQPSSSSSSSWIQDKGQRGMIVQNLAVCRIFTGQISEARRLLETALSSSSSSLTPSDAETTKSDNPGINSSSSGEGGGVLLNRGTTFNLATIYELTSDKSREMKAEMTRAVARLLQSSSTSTTTAPTMNMNTNRVVRDWMNADFKLPPLSS